MCDINKKTGIKKITVYKVAIKDGHGGYVSWISKVPIKLGAVKVNDKHDYNITNYFFNPNMIGRCSGFKRFRFLNNAPNWVNRKDFFRENGKCILRIILSGDIMEGTSMSISDSIPEKEIVYAGTYIESIQEINKDGRRVTKN